MLILFQIEQLESDQAISRKLVVRLVLSLMFGGTLGAGFLVLGAVFFKRTYEIYKEDDTVLPLACCILGIGKILE